jgi:hypothetical protein
MLGGMWAGGCGGGRGSNVKVRGSVHATVGGGVNDMSGGTCCLPRLTASEPHQTQGYHRRRVRAEGVRELERCTIWLPSAQ